MIKKIKTRLRQWNLNRKMRNGVLEMTPRGRCFYEYCQKIADGELKENERIEAYEEQLRDTVDYVKARHSHLDDEVLRVLCAQANLEVFREGYEN